VAAVLLALLLLLRSELVAALLPLNIFYFRPGSCSSVRLLARSWLDAPVCASSAAPDWP